MTAASSTSESSVPELIRRFEQELLQATDPQAVLERYLVLHPELAEMLREVYEAVQMLQATQFRPAPETDPARSQIASPRRFGPYRVVRSIGRGGMGEVYEAVEEPLGRRVAVKTIRRSQPTSASLLLRFDRERRTLARLHHTNIVPIFATGCEEDLLYFAMPYLSGASLGQVIKTARSRGSSGDGLTRSSFEELLQEAHSRSQSASEEPEEAAAEQPGPAMPGVAEPVAVGSPERPSSSTPGPDPHLLSKTYIRTVVQVMAAVAKGVHHAHEAGVIHRDLKPSNIMVETGGHAWVLDFGLAALKTASCAGPVAFAFAPKGAESDASLTAGPLGTPPYMAPEQHRDGKQADIRSDVWGLGVTLYELLTLQRAFPSGQAVLDSEPIPPRRHNPTLDRDLEAIVFKALRKNPDHRYPTALALADDLNRWLRHEPTAARPARMARRLALWSWRNPGWAAAIAVASLAVIGIVLGETVHLQSKANAALASAKSARRETALLSERDRQQRHELLLQSIQHKRTSLHEMGWADEVWGKIRDAATAGAGDGTIDRTLQSQAVADLFGLDIRHARRIKDFGADTLSFDRKDGSLLIGGVVGPNDRRCLPISSKLLSSTYQPPRDLATAAYGPVAFRPDGTPVQFVSTDREEKTLDVPYLVDMSTGKTLTRFTLPGTLAIESSTQVGFAPDASLAAAPVMLKTGETMLVVWDAGSGQERRRFTWPSTSIAFSPDGSLVASGSADGRITVWSMTSGEIVAALGAGRTEIRCLAFGRDPLLRTSRDPKPKASAHGWLLAAGDRGATVTIYDLKRRQARSICRGSGYDIFAVAFSHDGAMLASSGRGAHLWDVTTGVRLLSFVEGDYSHGLAFSPDDRRLAIGTMPVWSPGSVSLLDLESRREIQTCRGLTGQVSQVRFSRDGRRLAALSHDWQAAVWDRDSVRLVAIINVPPAQFVDNASLALSPDGQHLAYAGGHEARLWNLETGEERGWSFREGEADHEGLQDQLAFTGPDRLLSARVENRDGRGFPAGVMSPDQPKVVRVRNLLGSEPIKPITEVTDLELAVHGNQLTSDGRFLVAGGFTGPPGHPRHLLNGYEVSTGKRLWSAPVNAEPNQLYVRLDPTSSTLLWWVGDRGYTLLDIADGRYLGTIERRGYPSLGPRASLIMGFDSGTDDEPSGLELRRRDNDGEHRLFRLGQDSSFQAGALDARIFTSDGGYAAVGNTDGSVFVFDFEAINRRLSGIGMGW